MSLLPDDEKYDKFSNGNVSHAPPVRKLFSPAVVEVVEANGQEKDTFKVFLRIKPNSKIDNSNDCIVISDDTKLVCKPPASSKFKKLEKVQYTFSHIFGPETTQKEIFSKCIASSVKDLLLARNGLIFAYGTTNAGKTFTVQGSSKNPGIIPQVLYTLFNNIEIDRRVQYKPCMAKDILKLKSSTGQEEFQVKNEILRTFKSSTKFGKSTSSSNDSSHFMQALQKSFIQFKCNKPRCSIWISFVEVYNETIYDLLDSTTTTSRKPLKLAADNCDNFYVKGLKHVYVSSADEAFTIYQFGKKNLNMAPTKMNETSSRSHCIFTTYVINLADENQPFVSKLSVCDLAGTERLTKTQNTGLRLKESGNINGSLFQLNRCLRAIRENQIKRTNHLIPYRYSNLTKLLHTALDDRTNERIIMIVNINPSAELYDETQQVLKMCAMASKIKNKPIANTIQRNNRFTSLVHGRPGGSLDGDQRIELSDFEEDSEEETEELLEVKELKERLMRVEEELRNSKIREAYLENTKKNLKEYCDKIENTYKNRVKSLEERLQSQKKYYLWKVEDVKKNTILESTCSETVKEELLKKEAQIEDLEKKLMNLHHVDGFKRLSYSEEVQTKEAKIRELVSLVQEAKDEYLFLEKKYKTDIAKLHELENELCDKNEIIENMENALNSKQNMIEELELKVESMEETLDRNTIEQERIFYEMEKDRDVRLASRIIENEKLNLMIASLKQEIVELTQKVELDRKMQRSEETEIENMKLNTDKENPKSYNLRRNNRTPLGKVNRLDDESSADSNKSVKKRRAKKKPPLTAPQNLYGSIMDVLIKTKFKTGRSYGYGSKRNDKTTLVTRPSFHHVSNFFGISQVAIIADYILFAISNFLIISIHDHLM